MSINASLPILASWYANKFGVPVVLDRSLKTEHTDGKSVHIPQIDFEELKERNSGVDVKPIKNAVIGWLVHGCMHVRSTDFTLKNIPPEKFRWVNILEDARIEREALTLWPGSLETLSGLSQYLLDQNLYLKDPLKARSFGELVFQYALFKVQAEVAEHDCLTGYAKSFQVEVIKQGGKKFTTKLDNLLLETKKTSSTQDVVVLVDKIFELFKEESDGDQDSDQGNSQGNGEDENQNQDPDNSQENSQDHHDDQSEQGDSQDDDQDRSQDQNQGESQGNGQDSGQNDNQDSDQGNSQGNGEDENQNQDPDNSQENSQDHQDGQDESLSDKFKTLFDLSAFKAEEAFDKLGETFGSFALASESKVTPNRFPLKGRKLESSLNYSWLINEAKANSTSLAIKLRALLQSKNRSDSRLERSGRKIDSARLHKVKTGNFRVFRRQEEKEMPFTAVSILLDASGSMNVGTELKEAQKACFALAQALQPLKGITTAVNVFKGDTRLSPGFDVDLIEILDYEESSSSNASKFFDFSASGTTPLSEALWPIGISLVQRKENKKIVFVITDGEPDNKASALHIVEKLAKEGIVIIGIGIGHDAHKHVPGLFQHYVLIQSANELNNVLFNLIKNELL